MKKNKKRDRYMIITAGVWAVSAVVLGGGYFLLHLPQKTERIQIDQQSAQTQTALEQAQLASQEQARARQMQRHEDVQQLISGFSVPQDAVTELVFEIGRIANELNLLEFSSKRNNKQNHSTVGSSKLVSEVWLNVEFQATFEQVAQFIHRLECHKPVVFVEEVSFRRSPEGDRNHRVSFQLSFLTETESKKKQVAAVTP